MSLKKGTFHITIKTSHVMKAYHIFRERERAKNMVAKTKREGEGKTSISKRVVAKTNNHT